MSNVVDFLERMGQDAQLRHAASDEVERALANTGIDPVMRAAIFSEDQRHLEALLGASTNVCCMVRPADDEESEEDDDQDEQNDDDGGGEEDDELTSRRSSLSHAAGSL